MTPIGEHVADVVYGKLTSEKLRGAVEDDQLLYPQVRRYFRETPWAILPDRLALMSELVRFRAKGGRLTREQIEERIGDGAGAAHASLVERLARLTGEDTSSPDVQARMETAAARRVAGYVAGTVAVLPLYGVLMPRATAMSQLSGGTSVQEFASALQAAATNETVSSILLDVNSPGGSTDLIAEAAAAIRDARSSKPVEAIANCDAASAAYWLASQADSFWVTPSGMVGSIGVVMEHDDYSAQLEMIGVKVTLIYAGQYKTEGNPYEPLGADAVAAFQSIVDDYYDMFVADVASGRGASAADVKAGYGQGRMLTAKEAVDANMVDGIDTFDSVFGRLARGGAAKPKRRAEAPGGLLELETGAQLLPAAPGTGAVMPPAGPGSDKPSVHDPASRDEHDPWALTQALNETLTKEN